MTVILPGCLGSNWVLSIELMRRRLSSGSDTLTRVRKEGFLMTGLHNDRMSELMASIITTVAMHFPLSLSRKVPGPTVQKSPDNKSLHLKGAELCSPFSQQ